MAAESFKERWIRSKMYDDCDFLNIPEAAGLDDLKDESQLIVVPKLSLLHKGCESHAVAAHFSNGIHVFLAEWDDEGVFLYQAFKPAIADWAIENQRFGGPDFFPKRMTWVKPSFAWLLYRSGYGSKHNQSRLLKIKIPHGVFAELLSACQCKEGGGGSKGRVQWDPARDIMTSNGKEPRKMLRQRAIQIGLSNDLSEKYVNNILSITDVTELGKNIGLAHHEKTDEKVAKEMSVLLPILPLEKPYLPQCSQYDLVRLKLIQLE